jgi:hypothetical protein
LFVAAGGLQEDALARPLLAEFQKALELFGRVGQAEAVGLVLVFGQPDDFQESLETSIPTYQWV